MSRSRRLLELIQILRARRRPVAGAVLAAELGISLRTLYRDIATLQAQGAGIDGEAGLGYVLRPGFLLPPLMFSADEIEALVLGARWVATRGDAKLAGAAGAALAKVAAVVPDALREILNSTTLLISPKDTAPGDDRHVAGIRQAIRGERKIEIGYRDLREVASRRTVWPFALGYFDEVQVLAAWCELRQGFRHFRTDRILDLTVTDQRAPRRRQPLLQEWRQLQGIPADTF